MTLLPLTYAPNPIFKQKAEPVTEFNAALRQLTDQMLDTLERERGLGLGANMVGILKRIVVIDLHPNGISTPYILINPEITWSSSEQQTNEEASLSYPGISANITRPKAIKLTYQDLEGSQQSLHAEDFLACVIQHEIDYLNGTVYLDYLSKTKRDMLLKKMQKYMKANPPINHGHGCGCC